MSSINILKAFNTFKKYKLDIKKVNENTLKHLQRTIDNGYVCSKTAIGRSELLCDGCIFDKGIEDICGKVNIILFVKNSSNLDEPLVTEIDEIYGAMETLLGVRDE